MYDLDLEVAEGLAEIFGADPGLPLARGDWRARRSATHAMFAEMWRLRPPPDDVATKDVVIAGGSGQPMTVRMYRKRGQEEGAVLLYLHGGGMIMGDLETHDGVCRTYASDTGLAVVAVDYRLAPEHPFPAPVDDCVAALGWIATGGVRWGLDPARVVIGGESAGGGLAAAVALRARDEGGLRPVGQLLLYPMLDDRTYDKDDALERVAVWGYEDHVTAWSCYLGAGAASRRAAAPLRADDLRGLPPTYLECGELDIFRQENVAFALRLLQAGVRLEMHLHPGAPHAFELFAPRAAVSRRAMVDRRRALHSFVGIGP